mmetsp:Transcript_113838/g.185528  ORF Transcript_113838/g.185528 Transcript_113838/m.185528 type:complete len:207 (+) Transcript_113838:48-668(+)
MTSQAEAAGVALCLVMMFLHVALWTADAVTFLRVALWALWMVDVVTLLRAALWKKVEAVTFPRVAVALWRVDVVTLLRLSLWKKVEALTLPRVAVALQMGDEVKLTQDKAAQTVAQTVNVPLLYITRSRLCAQAARCRIRRSTFSRLPCRPAKKRRNGSKHCHCLACYPELVQNWTPSASIQPSLHARRQSNGSRRHRCLTSSVMA